MIKCRQMTSYEKIWEVAEDWFGIITFSEAVGLGLSKQSIHSMVKSGMLRSIGHGAYQVKHHVPGIYDVFAMAVAAAGPKAYLAGASVVALLDLAPTDPGVIYVGASGRVRRRLPDGVMLCKPGACRTTEYRRIRCQRAADALAFAMAHGQLDAGKVAEAARAAAGEGLMSDEECSEFQGQP